MRVHHFIMIGIYTLLSVARTLSLNNIILLTKARTFIRLIYIYIPHCIENTVCKRMVCSNLTGYSNFNSIEYILIGMAFHIDAIFFEVKTL